MLTDAIISLNYTDTTLRRHVLIAALSFNSAVPGTLQRLLGNGREKKLQRDVRGSATQIVSPLITIVQIKEGNLCLYWSLYIRWILKSKLEIETITCNVEVQWLNKSLYLMLPALNIMLPAF